MRNYKSSSLEHKILEGMLLLSKDCLTLTGSSMAWLPH